MQQQIQFIQSPDRVGLAVATVGSGPPLVIIPGWISHLELDWAFPAGREFYQRLAERDLVVRYDKRGTGLSDRNISDCSPEANLRDLEAIISGLGLKRPTLMGALVLAPGRPGLQERGMIEYALRPERARGGNSSTSRS